MKRTMQHKAGIALLAGAVISVLRVLPIALADGVGSDRFPPESLEDIVYFSQLSSWHISHVLFLVLLPLLGFGVVQLARDAARNGAGSASLMATTVFSLSLISYLVAIIFDGFVLPHVAEHPDALTDGSPEAALVLFTHEAASIVGGTASALMLVAALFIGIAQLTGLGHRRLGLMGIAIGAISSIGYLTGLLDLNISNGFNRVGPLLMATFVYLGATGIRMIRTAKDRNTATVPPSREHQP